MTYRILLFSRSIHGVGICSTLAAHPDEWQVSAVEPIRDLATLSSLMEQTSPPAITIFDDASPSDLFSVFEQLGVSQLRQFGRMVVITATGIEEETLFLFAKWGVMAHLRATIEPQALVDTLHKVAEGSYLLSEDSLSSPVPAPLTETSASPSAVPAASPLTVRETEVLGCIAQGMSNKAIAHALSLQGTNVKNYVTAIHTKLHQTNRTSAVAYALQQGWLELPVIRASQEAVEVTVA